MEDLNNTMTNVKDLLESAGMCSQARFVHAGLHGLLERKEISLDDLSIICRSLGLSVVTKEKMQELEGAAQFAAMGGGYKN